MSDAGSSSFDLKTAATPRLVASRSGAGLKIIRPGSAKAQFSPDIAEALTRMISTGAGMGPALGGGIVKTAMSDGGAPQTDTALKTSLHNIRDDANGAPGITREQFLQTFFLWGGLHFGMTIDDVITRYGLPSESSETMVAYEHTHAKGPGLLLVQTPDDSKLINYVVVHGPGGIDFLGQHNVTDQRLAMIGMHKDDILKILGAPTQNVGELEDGRVCFGYSTLIGIEATSPGGETIRFGLVIYVLFYLMNRDIPFCIAISTQWEPVMLEDMDDVA